MEKKVESDSGCILTALGMVAGLAAIEGGIVLIAASLHQILGARAYHPLAMAAAIGGVLLLTACSIFIPVPRLGAMSASRGEGLWEQHPEQAVMMGALHFALLGFCELYGGFNKVPAATGLPGRSG